MANKSFKQAQARAKVASQWYIYLILACNLIYIAGRVALFWSSINFYHAFGLIVTSVCYYVAFNIIIACIKEKSEATYGQDLMYITCAVQVCSVYSDKAWYLFLSIPAYLIYKFGGMLLSFLGSGSGGGGAVPDAGASNDGDEDFDLSTKAGRRAAKKAEKKNKPRVKYSRR